LRLYFKDGDKNLYNNWNLYSHVQLVKLW
jgi:hypothetical protein